MAKKNLHPSVQKFKRFVQKHPLLIKEVRKGNMTWQQLYEEWYLLGEEDPKWKSYRTSDPFQKDSQKEQSSSRDEEKFAFFQQLANTLKNVDVNKFQYYVRNLSEAIDTIQGMISEFQGSKGSGQRQQETGEQTGDPFSFRRD